METELAARQILEQQNVELMQKLEKRHDEESRALADAAEQAKMADTLRQELAQVRALAEEVKAQEAQNTAKIAQLSDEHTTTVRNLEATQSTREDLEAQLRLARAGNEEATKMLEKERLLQAQATEHGRILQQRISEADGQRTALELQLSMCRAERDDVIQQLKDAQSNAELADVDARKAREELTEVEHELKEAKETESSIRDLLKTSVSSQSDREQRLEDLTCKLREAQSSAELAKAEAVDLRERLQRTEHVERLLRADLVASRASQSDSERRIEEITRQLTDAQTSIELANTDASTAREELQRTECELGMMKQIERSLRDDLKASRASQLDTEKRLEEVTTQLKEAQANAEVVNNEALGLKEELRRATDELTVVRDVESSLRVDFEAIRASHLDTEKRFEDATRRLKEAQSNATSVRKGLQRVEDTLAEAKRIEQSLREELRTSRVSQSEADQRLDDVTQHLKRVQSDAHTDVEGVKEELRRVKQELRAARTVEGSLREDLRNAQSSAEAEVNMREKLHQMEHEVKEAKRIEGMLRDNLVLTGRISQSDFEQRFEESNQLVAQLLDIAVASWNTHHKALQKFQSMTTHPNTKEGQEDNLGEAVSSPHLHSSVAQEPPPIDTADVTRALEILREFDHDGFLDRATKVGSVIRKWQKQCKIYRERAKGKIAFRNFSQGDLALFLPTRNTPSKPWAAFNGETDHPEAAKAYDMLMLIQFRFPTTSCKRLATWQNN